MIITTDRKEFDEVLKVPENTFLVIFGEEGTAQEIYEKASDASKIEDWNITVKIENLKMLTPEEKTAWYKDNTHCALLAKPDADGQRIIVEQVAFSDLCTPKGFVSIRKINAAFGRADKGGDKA